MRSSSVRLARRRLACGWCWCETSAAVLGASDASWSTALADPFWLQRRREKEGSVRHHSWWRKRRWGEGKGGDIPRITVSLPVLDGEAAGVVLDGDALTAGLAEDAPRTVLVGGGCGGRGLGAGVCLGLRVSAFRLPGARRGVWWWFLALLGDAGRSVSAMGSRAGKREEAADLAADAMRDAIDALGLVLWRNVARERGCEGGCVRVVGTHSTSIACLRTELAWTGGRASGVCEGAGETVGERGIDVESSLGDIKMG